MTARGGAVTLCVAGLDVVGDVVALAVGALTFAAAAPPTGTAAVVVTTAAGVVARVVGEAEGVGVGLAFLVFLLVLAFGVLGAGLITVVTTAAGAGVVVTAEELVGAAVVGVADVVVADGVGVGVQLGDGVGVGVTVVVGVGVVVSVTDGVGVKVGSAGSEMVGSPGSDVGAPGIEMCGTSVTVGDPDVVGDPELDGEAQVPTSWGIGTPRPGVTAPDALPINAIADRQPPNPTAAHAVNDTAMRRVGAANPT